MMLDVAIGTYPHGLDTRTGNVIKRWVRRPIWPVTAPASVADFRGMTDDDLLCIRNIGRVSLPAARRVRDTWTDAELVAVFGMRPAPDAGRFVAPHEHDYLDVENLVARIATLEAALAYYADGDLYASEARAVGNGNWRYDSAPIVVDAGRRARAALGKDDA